MQNNNTNAIETDFNNNSFSEDEEEVEKIFHIFLLNIIDFYVDTIDRMNPTIHPSIASCIQISIHHIAITTQQLVIII